MSKISENSLATVAEYESIYGEVAVSDVAKVESLLLASSNNLRMIARNNGKDLDDMILGDSTGIYGANVRNVILASAERVMSAPNGLVQDMSQWSQSASPYSESMSFSGGANTNIFFKDRELKLLGFNSVSGRPNIAVLRGVRGE